MNTSIKRTLAVFMAAALSTGATVTAFASEEAFRDSDKNAIVHASIDATTFRVTLPSILPIYVDNNRNVTTAQDAEIHNDSAGPIKVTNLEFLTYDDWEAIPFDSDITSLKLGRRQIGFSINGSKTISNGAFQFSQAGFSPIPAQSRLWLNYGAIANTPTLGTLGERVAQVIFTVDWDEKDIEKAFSFEFDEYTVAVGEYIDLLLKLGDDYVYSTGEELSVPPTASDASVAHAGLMNNIAVTVTGLKEGTTTIEQEYNGQKATCKVTVFSQIPAPQDGEVVDLGAFRYTFSKGGWAVSLLSTGRREYISPETMIRNYPVNSLKNLFKLHEVSDVTLVDWNTDNITDMSGMFQDSAIKELDLRSFNTSKVTKTTNMFLFSQANTINVTSFDMSNVTDSQGMFSDTIATEIDTSNFNLQKARSISTMFARSMLDVIDLSGFEVSSSSMTPVTGMRAVFSGSSATIGYARTQEDADKFNSVRGKPDTLTFVVK